MAKRISAWPSQRARVEGSGSSVGELSQARRGPSPLSGSWEMQRRSSALLSSTFHHLIPNSQALERAEPTAPFCSRFLCTFFCCCPRNPAGEDAQASHPTAPEGIKDPVFGTNPLFSRGEEDHLLPLYQFLLSPQHPLGCVKRQLCPRAPGA